MKIAVAGKGGVGKSTISAMLSLSFSRSGKRVLAIDADPDANLARILGVQDPGGIAPLLSLKDLIAERTGAGPGAGLFKLNPDVDDLPERFSKKVENVRVMAMGTFSRGGAGCACPESAFLKRFLSYALFEMEDAVVMDMEAGLEHLGRGTAAGFDCMLAIVEPNPLSIETAGKITLLAGDIGINNVLLVLNKVRSSSERDWMEASMPQGAAGCIPFLEALSGGLRHTGGSIPQGFEIPSEVGQLRALIERCVDAHRKARAEKEEKEREASP